MKRLYSIFPNVRSSILAAVCAICVLTLPGCQLFTFHKVKAATPSKPEPSNEMLPVNLSLVQPNEAGLVPILMYHGLITSGKPGDTKYPVALFRKDIEWLYAHKFRPISLRDYVKGRIDCPAGMSPVVLTFDDAVLSQFRFTNDGKIDSDCVVGILDDFHAKHPDWPLRGTFFVLTDADPKLPPPFYQKQYAQGKLEYLVKEGFEIGNHTVHHMKMNTLSNAAATAEIAGAVAGIHKYLPDYNVDELALPYGLYPRDPKVAVSGKAGGVTYHNIAVLKAAWRPMPSPMSPEFHPYALERISPGTQMHQAQWWLNYLEKHKDERFVSDGDPNTYTVNIIAAGQLDKKRIQSMHFHIRTYNGTTVEAAK